MAQAIIIIHICKGIRTLAYGHKDIKRIVAERCNSASAGENDMELEQEDEEPEEVEEEIPDESDEQLEILADRIYLKVNSITNSKESKESTLRAIEECSGGRIKEQDSEKFLELMRDNSLYSLEKKNLLKMRVKNLLMFRKKKL